MRELIAITNRNKIIFQLIMTAVFLTMLGLSVWLILQFSDLSYLGVVIPFVFLIVYSLLDIVNITLLPMDRILRVENKLFIHNRKGRSIVLSLKEIISLDSNFRMLGYGHMYLFTKQATYVVKYLKDIDKVQNKIVSLMVEYKNPYFPPERIGDFWS